jgi:hypothetical protein
MKPFRRNRRTRTRTKSKIPMEILLAMLVNFSIVRDDVHLDIANLSKEEVTRITMEYEAKQE